MYVIHSGIKTNKSRESNGSRDLLVIRVTLYFECLPPRNDLGEPCQEQPRQ